MDSRMIETRLRLPAADEPAVLPPLRLPALDQRARVRSSVRFRQSQRAGDPSMGFLLGLLALIAAGVIVAGTLRLLQDRPTPLNQLQWPPAEGVLGVQDGFTMDWPSSWHRLAEGGLFQGDFTQDGISYERVALILASSELPGCASPGASEGPAVYASGDPPIQPRVADPAVACLRTAPLPPGAIRLVAEVGERTRGLMAPNGPAIADTSEPTEGSGWAEQVDGQPARLTVVGGAEASAVGAVEVRIWDVIFPGTIDHVLRLRAEIAGPDPDAGRAAVQAIVDSIDFATDPPELEQSSAATSLVALIDDMDRSSRQAGSDFFACFPREPGAASGTISSGLGEKLVAPVTVTCSTAIAPSKAGLWRITLTTQWAAGDGYAAGGLVQEFFAQSDGSTTGTSATYAIDAAGTPQTGSELRFPQAPRSLPDPLDGPLGLTAGSFVELLWPGVSSADSPGNVSSDIYPGGVGSHVYVVDDPAFIDGVEWYPVQWDEGSWYAFTKWLPATRDGRPTIRAVEPSCPTGEVNLAALMWLTAAERLACFGDQDLTLGPVMAAADGAGYSPCLDAFSQPTMCPDAEDLSWLEADPVLLLYGERGPRGAIPGLAVWSDPAAVAAIPTGQLLRVTGHFDDRLALECRDAPNGVPVGGATALRDLLLGCRERFVVTAFEPATAP
ncbi:MAG: hypothetical protein ABI620_03410 [Chloroflexota bacterium]